MKKTAGMARDSNCTLMENSPFVLDLLPFLEFAIGFGILSKENTVLTI
jgi:hypothetical protein